MPDHAIDRRNFAARLTGAVAALGGALAVADEPKTAETSDSTAVESTELLLELIKRIDPDRIKAEHLDLLRADLAANLQRSARLSAFPLTNADEPAPVFSTWRSEG